MFVFIICVSEVVGPDDARATLAMWQTKLTRDVQEVTSIVIKLQGLECADQLIKQVTDAGKASTCKLARSPV